MYVVFLILFSIFGHQIEAALPCNIKLEAVGCYQDYTYNRSLPRELVNERDTTSKVYNGRLVDWKDPNYLPSFICRCAKIAKRLGHMYIGIQYHAECWSGRNSHMLYDKHGISRQCQKNWHYNPKCDVQTGKGNANYVYKILDSDCGTDYKPLGCYHDNQIKPRPLPFYAMNERDKTSWNWNGKEIDWKRWDLYLPRVICRCAQKARDLGHDIFAIQFYGECWTGKIGASNYRRDGRSANCIGADFKPCTCYAYHCAGRQKTNYVYQLNRKPSCSRKTSAHRRRRRRRRRRYYYHHRAH